MYRLCDYATVTSPCHVTEIGNKTANINAKNIVYHTS